MTLDGFQALGTWLLVPITAVLTWLFAQKQKKVALGKARSEASSTGIETIEKAFDFKVKSEMYYEGKIAVLQAKLDIISLKLESMTEQSQKWESMHKEVIIQVDEMKAQLTVWKTISK